MASIPGKKIPIAVAGSGASSTAYDMLRTRESPELVIAFSGPLGSGIDNVLSYTSQHLEGLGYKTYSVKVSQHIKECMTTGLIEKADLDQASEHERVDRLQTGGNSLRKIEPSILAQYAVQIISQERVKALGLQKPEDIRNATPTKSAYLIDQLKHPAEVSLLRSIYGNMFFLVGVLCIEEKRRKRLEERGMTTSQAATSMERDQREADTLGQQLDKTLQLADFFVRNSDPNSESIKITLARFFGLIHGSNGITPTRDEYGMYAAYSAGLRSACLSRQVGASITDSKGNLLATGCNDVPRFGGGLYGPEAGADDARCVKKEEGKCYNDYHKLKLRKQIEDVLREETSLRAPPEKAKELVAAIAERIYKSSRIKDLIEFSRSVHAEMDAIVSVARKGGMTVVGGTMYTTTFPCHSCARHIVAAGITDVFYIEPYEKSLASELHDDAISLDKTANESQQKVRFVHYEGVHPKQYINFFQARDNRKTASGKAIFPNPAESPKSVPEYLSTYIEKEAKVVLHLQKIEAESAAKSASTNPL